MESNGPDGFSACMFTEECFVSEVVNLNRARKARARKEDKATAAGNRARFGRTKEQKTLEKAQADKAAKALDDARRED